MQAQNLRIIIIDAKNREIREEFHSGDSLKILQTAVGGYIERAVTLENGDDVYVNEEGLLRLQEEQFRHCFAMQVDDFAPYVALPFVGNAVIVGTQEIETKDPDGEVYLEKDTGAARSSLEDIKRRVRFMTLGELKQMQAEQEKRVL